jgi:hypothetical protein
LCFYDADITKDFNIKKKNQSQAVSYTAFKMSHNVDRLFKAKEERGESKFLFAV